MAERQAFPDNRSHKNLLLTQIKANRIIVTCSGNVTHLCRDCEYLLTVFTAELLALFKKTDQVRSKIKFKTGNILFDTLSFIPNPLPNANVKAWNTLGRRIDPLTLMTEIREIQQFFQFETPVMDYLKQQITLAYEETLYRSENESFCFDEMCNLRFKSPELQRVQQQIEEYAAEEPPQLE